MKSLEIVNDLIWKTQKKYDYVDTNQDKKQLEKQLEEFNSEFNKLQQIKQDLEVLEILKNKFHLDILENGYFDCIDLSYDSVNPNNLPKEEYELLKELLKS